MIFKYWLGIADHPTFGADFVANDLKSHGGIYLTPKRHLNQTTMIGYLVWSVGLSKK
jgi:hypothetical protein